MEKVHLPPYEELCPTAPTSHMMYPAIGENNVGQPQMYQPQMQQPQQAPIILQNVPQPGGGYPGALTLNYGPRPQDTLCQFCNTRVRTNVDNKATTRTHCVALALCCFLCWPCVCVPYCMDSCQNQNHSCPQCKTYLGSYEH